MPSEGIKSDIGRLKIIKNESKNDAEKFYGARSFGGIESSIF